MLPSLYTILQNRVSLPYFIDEKNETSKWVVPRLLDLMGKLKKKKCIKRAVGTRYKITNLILLKTSFLLFFLLPLPFLLLFSLSSVLFAFELLYYLYIFPCKWVKLLFIETSDRVPVIQSSPDTWKLHKVHRKRIGKGISGNARKNKTTMGITVLISWKMAAVKA